MLRILLSVLISACPLTAQFAGSMVPFQPGYNELKAALNLTEDQLAQMKLITQTRTQATQAAYREIAQKQKTIGDLLEAGNADAVAIGTLTIEVQKLRTALIARPGGDRDQTLAILTPAQRSKLVQLQEALNLRQAADQAAGFGLIEIPKMNAVPLPQRLAARP